MSYSELVSCFIRWCTLPLGVCVLACLIRAVIGPRLSDRLVAVNMAGTQVICLIALIALASGESGFADIAIIYAMLSFLAVVVLTAILSGRRRGK